MKYGYCRCSTNELKQDIDRQVRDLKKLGVKQENIYLEYDVGTKVNRVEFKNLLKVIGKNDTLVATEVSRITRSTRQLLDIIQIIEDRNIRLELGNIVLDCTEDGRMDVTTKAMLQMMGVFSELEKNMISERVKSGMDNARSKGKKIGRPKTTIDDIPDSVKKHYELYKEGRINKSEYAKLCSISRTSLYKYIDIMGKKG